MVERTRAQRVRQFEVSIVKGAIVQANVRSARGMKATGSEAKFTRLRRAATVQTNERNRGSSANDKQKDVVGRQRK